MIKGIDLFNAGFKQLVSVTPYNCELADNSTINPKDLGKAPGIKYASGKWGGYAWRSQAVTADMVRQWDAAGANIGLACAAFPALDIDVLDENLVAEIRKLALDHLGFAPIRIGRHPKALLMYRAKGKIETQRLRFVDVDTGELHLVEFLGDGAQFVVSGKHAVTHKDYVVDQDLTSLTAGGLTEIDAEKVDSFILELKHTLELFGYKIESHNKGAANRDQIDQDKLRSTDLDKFEKIVAALPNDFADRETYIAVGYAIKGATQSDPGRGLAMFLDWCSRWSGGVNDADTVELDWQRMLPPFELGEDYIYRMAQAAGVYEPANDFDAVIPEEGEEMETTAPGGPIMFSESSLAQRFARKHAGRAKYVGLWKRWVIWNGARWEKDDTEHHIDLIRNFCDVESNRALNSIDAEGRAESTATRLAAARTFQNIAAISRSLRSVSMAPDAFDADPDLLNTPGGVVDLKSGKLKQARPDMYMSKSTNVTPNIEMECPLWDKFLDEVTQGDDSLKEYLQVLAGYAATGHTGEHLMPFFHGVGSNGKSVFLETISWILGDYATTTPVETLTASDREKNTADLADLAGVRMVTAQETEAGKFWDEQRVKLLTGGDLIKARFLHANFFTFKPQFTIIVAGNHEPRLKSAGPAMRRRIKLVPWRFVARQRDVSLPMRLRAEAPAILDWIVQGAAKWYAEGFPEVGTVEEATTAYFEAEDVVGRFAKTCLDVDYSTDSEAADIYAAFVAWCAEENMKPWANRTFFGELQVWAGQEGVYKAKHPRTRRIVWKGVKVLPVTKNVVEFRAV